MPKSCLVTIHVTIQLLAPVYEFGNEAVVIPDGKIEYRDQISPRRSRPPSPPPAPDTSNTLAASTG